MANPLRVNTVELLRRQGSDRELDVTVPFESLGAPDDRADDRIDAEAPVHVKVRLEAANDGVLVTGSINAPWHGTCRRCALETGGELVAEVDERYQEQVTDPDSFEFDGVSLNLQAMVRELVLLDAPATPLCRPDCAGLCPTCGTDLNIGTCDCAPLPVDSPWGALDQLKQATPDA